jgi:hypothetical protein
LPPKDRQKDVVQAVITRLVVADPIAHSPYESYVPGYGQSGGTAAAVPAPMMVRSRLPLPLTVASALFVVLLVFDLVERFG